MEIIYLVEGETEKQLLTHLKVHGKISIYNLWDKDIKKIIRKFKSTTAVYVVFDTDQLTNITRFRQNLDYLIKSKYLAGILQQTLNLEDELVSACNVSNKQSLFKAFNSSSDSEFKTAFIATSNVVSKLSNQGFAPEKLWSQSLHPALSSYLKYQKGFNDLKLN